MSTNRVGNPKRVVAYIPVSTDEQKLGPEVQRAAIEAWAARERVTVTAWCIDARVSGGSDLADCPGRGRLAPSPRPGRAVPPRPEAGRTRAAGPPHPPVGHRKGRRELRGRQEGAPHGSKPPREGRA
ncbi:MAG: recombinase family protein [Candidatus Riflebacteria bacterium]|nr:recombinase family protein [Candidatus Riflebacteria bacterium]